jgi:hypothetical protein
MRKKVIQGEGNWVRGERFDEQNRTARVNGRREKGGGRARASVRW